LPAELTIVGIGLIGASFALAVRDGFERIVALDPDEANGAFAVRRGMVDQRVDVIRPETDAILLACPSHLIADWIVDLADHPATVFDAGSVKQAIISEVHDRLGQVPGNYVPTHPIAGLEQSGPQSASADLFEGRTVILTPLASTDPDRLLHVTGWWQAAGAVVEEMDPARHDQVYARTSHLPHLLAFAYLAGIDPEDLHHTGGGFRDFSRIGGSDPQMWAGIFDRNRAALIAALDTFELDLAEFRRSIEAGDLARCRALIAAARKRREAPE